MRTEKVLAGKLREAGGHRDRNRKLRIIPHEKVSELGTDPERVAGGHQHLTQKYIHTDACIQIYMLFR